MILSRQFFLVLSIIAIFSSCGSKGEAEDDGIDVDEFFEFFPSVELPVEFADSLLSKKEKDSTKIKHDLFKQFVNDSVIAPVFKKETKLSIYPVGRASGAEGDTWVIAKIVSPAKKAFFLLVFDKKKQFMTGMPVYRSDLPKNLQRQTVIDKKHTITKSQLKKNTDGTISEGKDVFVLNTSERKFILIMTDALEDKVTELINPIDTFARKNKLSADYSSGKTNIVSIRDGRKPDRLTFFIHFEKSNGSCNGELKGEAIIKSANLAEYRLNGDPCILQFRFTTSSVVLKEIEGCGVHRGLRCSFDGSYARKKEKKTKPQAATKK